MPDVVSSRSTARSAHRRSVEITIPDLMAALTQKLGSKLVAYIVSKDPSTLSRWRSQESHPSDESTRALRTAYQVFQLLESEESDHTIRAWFIGMNPQLDDASPAEALADGGNREVMAAARAFLAGG